MLKRKNIIKIAIDSPAAAGAGTQAKLISKHYNLLQLDTGRIYRYIANIKITEPKKFNYQYLKKKIDNLKISSLNNKKLLSDKVATIASIIAKDKKIRKLVHAFQLKCAYGLIASKIAATLASVGTPSFSISASEASHGDLGMISKKDILILLQSSQF